MFRSLFASSGVVLCNSACADGAAVQRRTIRQSVTPARRMDCNGRRTLGFTMPMCETNGRRPSTTPQSGNAHGLPISTASAGCARTVSMRFGRDCGAQLTFSQRLTSTTTTQYPSAGSGGSTGAIFAASVTPTTRQNARKRGRGVPGKVPDPALQHRAGRSVQKKVPNHGIAGTGRA